MVGHGHMCVGPWGGVSTCICTYVTVRVTTWMCARLDVHMAILAHACAELCVCAITRPRNMHVCAHTDMAV